MIGERQRCRLFAYINLVKVLNNTFNGLFWAVFSFSMQIIATACSISSTGANILKSLSSKTQNENKQKSTHKVPTLLFAFLVLKWVHKVTSARNSNHTQLFFRHFIIFWDIALPIHPYKWKSGQGSNIIFFLHCNNIFLYALRKGIAAPFQFI